MHCARNLKNSATCADVSLQFSRSSRSSRVHISRRRPMPSRLKKSTSFIRTTTSTIEIPRDYFLPDVAIPNGTESSGKGSGSRRLVHGRCMDGNSIHQLIDLKKYVDTSEFILAVPEGHRQNFWCSTCSRSDGILNTRYGCRTWAATEACCANAGPLRTTVVQEA